MTLNGCRLGFYEPVRKTLTTTLYHDPNLQSFSINLFAGASSGILGAAAGSPFFLVKTRLQSYSPFLPVGTQHHYRNALDGMRQIYSSEGIKGLYRGVGPAMVRTGFGSSVQLPTYFFAKRRLVKHLGMQEGMPLHIASSTASGFVVCCVMHPPDTVMSRMYNQTGNLYKSAFDCLARTVRTEGVLALYKGYFAHLARILPHTVCFFLFPFPPLCLFFSLGGFSPLSSKDRLRVLLTFDENRFSPSHWRNKLSNSCAWSKIASYPLM